MSYNDLRSLNGQHPIGSTARCPRCLQRLGCDAVTAPDGARVHKTCPEASANTRGRCLDY